MVLLSEHAENALDGQINSQEIGILTQVFNQFMSKKDRESGENPITKIDSLQLVCRQNPNFSTLSVTKDQIMLLSFIRNIVIDSVRNKEEFK